VVEEGSYKMLQYEKDNIKCADWWKHVNKCG